MPGAVLPFRRLPNTLDTTAINIRKPKRSRAPEPSEELTGKNPSKKKKP